MTQYSREVSELGEFGEAPNDNGPAESTPEPDEDKTVTPPLQEIGDAVPPPRGEDTDPEPATPPASS